MYNIVATTTTLELSTGKRTKERITSTSKSIYMRISEYVIKHLWTMIDRQMKEKSVPNIHFQYTFMRSKLLPT